MTHSHIRVATERPQTHVGRGVAIRIAIGLILFCMAVVAVRLVELWHEPVYVTTNGQIEQTRVAVAYTRATNYGGMIFYQIEALVSFQKDGKTEKRWLVASPAVRERDILLRRTSQNLTKCLVYCPQGNPDNVSCKIQDAWANYPGLNP